MPTDHKEISHFLRISPSQLIERTAAVLPGALHLPDTRLFASTYSHQHCLPQIVLDCWLDPYCRAALYNVQCSQHLEKDVLTSGALQRQARTQRWLKYFFRMPVLPLAWNQTRFLCEPCPTSARAAHPHFASSPCSTHT